jgi:hypothetical protein
MYERFIFMLLLSFAAGFVPAMRGKYPHDYIGNALMVACGLMCSMLVHNMYPVMFDHLFEGSSDSLVIIAMSFSGLAVLIGAGSPWTLFLGFTLGAAAGLNWKQLNSKSLRPLVLFVVGFFGFWTGAAEHLPNGVESATLVYRFGSDNDHATREREAKEWLEFLDKNWSTGMGYELFSLKDTKWFLGEEATSPEPVYVFIKTYYRGTNPRANVLGKCQEKHVGLLTASELRKNLHDINAKRCLPGH